MSETKRIESGDGDFIRSAPNGTHVVIEVGEAAEIGSTNIASIWLTPEQADEHIRQVAAARVEISKARPAS